MLNLRFGKEVVTGLSSINVVLPTISDMSSPELPTKLSLIAVCSASLSQPLCISWGYRKHFSESVGWFSMAASAQMHPPAVLSTTSYSRSFYLLLVSSTEHMWWGDGEAETWCFSSFSWELRCRSCVFLDNPSRLGVLFLHYWWIVH